jgi:hypothetical protein
MGYFLIVIGVICLVAGIMMLLKKKAVSTTVDKENTIVKTISNEALPQDSFDLNKAKGDAFEKFVVQNFDQQYFTIQEWRSDKYVNGVYAVSNHFPDLEVNFNYRKENIKDSFAVECKWRKSFYQNAIQWAENYQVANYREYASALSIPVFIVIGVGGEPSNPAELFIVPLDRLQTNSISQDAINQYKKYNMGKRFYWDYKMKKLE